MRQHAALCCAARASSDPHRAQCVAPCPRLRPRAPPAGASSFGVVVGFKLKTHPAPPYVLQLGSRFSYTADSSDLPWDQATSPQPANLFSTYFFNATWWSGLPLGLGGFLTVGGWPGYEMRVRGAGAWAWGSRRTLACAEVGIGGALDVRPSGHIARCAYCIVGIVGG
jgi:hypothetical protein